MRIISFMAVTFFTILWSLPTHAAETFVCNNLRPDNHFKKNTSPAGVDVATTSAVLNIEKDKITSVTYVVKLFSNGKIEDAVKYSLDCNVPDVENNELECLQDTVAHNSEGTKISTAEYSKYSYLKIHRHGDKPEASVLSDLRDGGILAFYFGDLMIKKTVNGTELDVSEDEVQLLKCN